MALKNLLYLVAIAVFLQNALANPVMIQQWRSSDENEILKGSRGSSEEANNSEGVVLVDVGGSEVLEVDAITVGVPEFTDMEQVRFIHDFNTLKTAIVDKGNQRCFVMDLDLERYSLPKSVFDLLWKMRSDYYAVDTDVVRQNMRVVLPPIQSYDDIGLAIRLSCSDFNTFMLVEVDGEVVFKRSIDTEPVIIGEKVGNRLLQFSIVNMNEVMQYEARK